MATKWLHLKIALKTWEREKKEMNAYKIANGGNAFEGFFGTTQFCIQVEVPVSCVKCFELIVLYSSRIKLICCIQNRNCV